MQKCGYRYLSTKVGINPLDCFRENGFYRRTNDGWADSVAMLLCRAAFDIFCSQTHIHTLAQTHMYMYISTLYIWITSTGKHHFKYNHQPFHFVFIARISGTCARAHPSSRTTGEGNNVRYPILHLINCPVATNVENMAYIWTTICVQL